jgi:hypothetical protein
VVGITLAAAEFLVEAAASGVSFERTLTIGRQRLLTGPDPIWTILANHGVQPNKSKTAFRRQLGWQPWADPLFKLLGASEVATIDASGWEGAGIIHDLNEPISGELHERFDAVVDCGTLEHVFNVPVALKSYLDMVRIGGHVILVLPANNLFGHGFYQFSAEFFYSALSERNGYVVERMLITRDDIDTVHRFRGRWQVSPAYGPRYEVADPRVVGQRVWLQGDPANMLMVQAERTARKRVFEAPPVQSDYVRAWDAHEAQAETAPTKSVFPRLHRRLPPRVREQVTQPVLLWLQWDGIPRLLPFLDPLARRRNRRERSLANRRLFKRIDR